MKPKPLINLKSSEGFSPGHASSDNSKTDLFVGLSFCTISATGANGAVIHYKPEKGTCATIDPKQIYLCDAGAQFRYPHLTISPTFACRPCLSSSPISLDPPTCQPPNVSRDGTTDTTRTLSFATPTPEQSRAYTLVLKGHIAIDRCVFPKSTTGFQIDSLARQYLWSDGLDYFHGTGHGVGSFLNVHEGPAGIGPRIAYNEAALKPGMVLSNGTVPLNTCLVSAIIASTSSILAPRLLGDAFLFMFSYPNCFLNPFKSFEWATLTRCYRTGLLQRWRIWNPNRKHRNSPRSHYPPPIRRSSLLRFRARHDGPDG